MSTVKPKGNKQYRSGRAVEYQITKLGKEQGWTISQRFAGSHGRADIMWWKPTGLGSANTLVDEQLKGDGWLPFYEREKFPAEVKDLPVPVYAYQKFCKGVSKRLIFVWVVEDVFSQVALFQVKRSKA